MLKICELNKSFGNQVVLKNLSYTFENGKSYAVIGKSGSGKSTLLNILGLLEKKDSGDIFYDKFHQVKINSKQATLLRRDTISYLFQNYALLDNETIEENLKIASHYVKLDDNVQSFRKAMEYVGVEKLLSTKICHLSGGEQQRVAIARLFLKESKIILADEPTGNLDKENAEEVFKMLVGLKKSDRIIIIVTHDVELASCCDEIINLDEF